MVAFYHEAGICPVLGFTRAVSSGKGSAGSGLGPLGSRKGTPGPLGSSAHGTTHARCTSVDIFLTDLQRMYKVLLFTSVIRKDDRVGQLGEGRKPEF